VSFYPKVQTIRVFELTCALVCLSLLGTWSGEPWRADQSTLLQVFVSIQSMILCDEPWTNEPGREMTRGTIESLRYNHRIRRLTTEHSLIPWAKELEKGQKNQECTWLDIIQKHFEVNVDRILYTTERWSQDAATSKPPTRGSFMGFHPSSFPPQPPSIVIKSNTIAKKPQDTQGKLFLSDFTI
jgi:hypothetical protein